MGFELESCCFCIELRTGSLILGYLSLVGNIIFTILSIIGLGFGGYIASEGKDADQRSAGEITMIIMGIILFFILLNLAFSIVLLVGLHKYKPGHVKAYLIYTGIYVIISSVVVISILCYGIPFRFVVRDIISLALSIYFLLVIKSYYKTMINPERKPTIYNTA